MKTIKAKIGQKRISKGMIVRLSDFTPWWIVCKECRECATLVPRSESHSANCKCANCGAIYSITLGSDWDRRMKDLPLWLRGNFRDEVFWSVNGDHLLFLEELIGATLRERPVHGGKRINLTTAMPFNLPSWMLSAKNRPALLHLIQKLKQRLPKDFVPAKLHENPR